MVDFTIPPATFSNPRSTIRPVPPDLTSMQVVSFDENFPPGRMLDVLIEFSYDNQASWQTAMNATGMRPMPPTNHIHFSTSFSPTRYPTHLRATLTPVGGAVTLGAVVTT